MPDDTFEFPINLHGAEPAQQDGSMEYATVVLGHSNSASAVHGAWLTIATADEDVRAWLAEHPAYRVTLTPLREGETVDVAPAPPPRHEDRGPEPLHAAAGETIDVAGVRARMAPRGAQAPAQGAEE